MTVPRRTTLVRAELLMLLAVKTEEWRKQLLNEDPSVTPIEQWPDDDPFVVLCRQYGLTPAQLASQLTRVGQTLETLALRAGYERALIDQEDL